MTLRMKYDRELEAMLSKLVKMARATEEAIEGTMDGLISGDRDKLKEVYANDKEIDNMEREIERNCFKLLLMEQPVATDFREVSAALKMITDFERIADQASDIAHLGLKVNLDSCKGIVSKIQTMASTAKSMLHEGVAAYINKDVQLAKSLSDKDDAVDEMFKEIKNEIVYGIKNSSVDAEEAILIMMIAKYLERIADHAVNVGEWVEYAVTGQHKAHKDLVY